MLVVKELIRGLVFRLDSLTNLAGRLVPGSFHEPPVVTSGKYERVLNAVRVVKDNFIDVCLRN